MTGNPLPLVVGLPGLTLEPDQREVLERVRPAGVILFSRNVASADQVRELTAELRELDPAPFLSVDLEGGSVNRFAAIWGELPPPARAAAHGRRAVRALGEATGAACRCLGIHMNLAPAVDLDRPHGMLTQQERCLAADPDRVGTLARIFAEGLHAWSVQGCLKHFPGLGEAVLDTHLQLPRLELTEDQLEVHLQAFRAVSETVPVVMVAHMVVPALGNDELPASLSPEAVEVAAALPGEPVILTDDLEMHALDGVGDLGRRVMLALRARCHGALVCHAFWDLPLIAEQIEREMGDDTSFRGRVSERAGRLNTLRRDLCRSFAAVPAPDDTTVDQLWEQARREAEG